ncbi:phosphatase [Catellatospora methionotrophica]|uniref:Phosphatase n=1 Tax=Catellatospora methionotrophica TaxID=121620 RepID=A0A8J3PKJ2_9ACTN|nr:PHP domain-containing protein [Catellatospora methionotrophica]GIG18521.1 phosphatase [Catellatospora methionotrophica]
MTIDLHLHSTASDGTTPPDELMRQAGAAGMAVVALTDHDTTAGWAAAAAALPPGLTLIRGAELSCRWHGAGESIPLHLLAYLFDPADEQLTAALARVRESRLGRAERMVALMRADGIDIDWDDILAHADGGTVGRPHLAAALIRAGLVADTQEAFGPRWIGNGSPYRLPKEDLDVFEALRLVQGAGGVTVFAHPRARVRGRVVPEEVFGQLAAAGLDGLEADHHDHSPAERDEVRRVAAALGLFVTGSSDFHGTHKKVRIGEYTTAPGALARIVAGATGATPVTGVVG